MKKTLNHVIWLNSEQSIGLDGVDEDIADVLNTSMWAYYEGDAAICYKGYEKEKELVEFFRKYCEDNKFNYEIIESHNEVKLVFPWVVNSRIFFFLKFIWNEIIGTWKYW